MTTHCLGRSQVTTEMVGWFNRQVSIWPAAYLIGVGREQYAQFIAQSLKSNGLE